MAAAVGVSNTVGVTVTKQSFASIVRQILAVAGIVMGVLTASVSSLHLPIALSSILTVAGAVILAIEHYVADPSTGTTPMAAVPVVPTATGTAVTVAKS